MAFCGRHSPLEFLVSLTRGQQQSKFQLMWKMLLMEPELMLVGRHLTFQW